jgi:outer membrane receptor protein involved in Fe transport
LCGPDEACYNPALSTSTNKNAYPAAVYFNWTGAVDVINSENKQLSVFAVVNNIFDRDPPQTALVGLINGGDPYDLVGRYFKAGVRFKF